MLELSLGPRGRRFVLGVAACCIAGVITACGASSSDPEEASSSSKPLTLGAVSAPLSVSTSLVEARDGMLAEAKRLGNVKVKYVVGDGAPDQLSQMQTLISQQVDAILIDPDDDRGIAPGVIAANKAGIPVVAWVGTSAEGELAGQVSFDELEGSRDITNWVFDKIGKTGNVGLLQGTKNHPAGRAREEAFREVLKSNPEVKLSNYSEAEWLQDVAYKNAQDFFTRTPDLKAVVAFTDEMAMGALKAAQDRNVDQPLVITGFNGNCAGLNSVWSKGITATLYQPWRDAGRAAVEIAVKTLRKQPGERRVVLPSLVIDRAEMEAILAGEVEATEGTKTSIKAASTDCR